MEVAAIAIASTALIVALFTFVSLVAVVARLLPDERKQVRATKEDFRR